MNILSPEVVISALIARTAIKKITHLEFEVILGTAAYFVGLTANRVAKYSARLGVNSYRRLKGLNVQLPQRTTEVHSVLDINSVYRLKGLEVILGFDHTRRPIRIDLDKYHTLIAGVTHAGKTTALNGIIAQLISRPYFREEYDLYLLDLKSSKEDYLALWKPVISGYFTIDHRGSSEEAIIALEQIAEQMHRQDSGKKILLIVDELAMLTSQSMDRNLTRMGHAIMQRLSAQIMDRGAILAATQRPHYEVVSRGVSSNLERKICLRVDDQAVAQMILRFKPTTDCISLRNGEFLLKEPGAPNREQIGRTLLMKLPQEIDKTVARLIEIDAESDERLAIFKQAAQLLNCGDTLPGVNREFWKGRGYGTELLRTAYKNYALAGATVAHVDKRNQPNAYLLSEDFKLAYRKVIEYIQQGKWQAAPETIGK